jgi:hypothetical protein
LGGSRRKGMLEEEVVEVVGRDARECLGFKPAELEE